MKGVSQNGQTLNIIEICSYCVLDRPVFECDQVLLHPELSPWWSFLFADGAHHNKISQPHPPQLFKETGKQTHTLKTLPYFNLYISNTNPHTAIPANLALLTPLADDQRNTTKVSPQPGRAATKGTWTPHPKDAWRKWGSRSPPMSCSTRAQGSVIVCMGWPWPWYPE